MYLCRKQNEMRILLILIAFIYSLISRAQVIENPVFDRTDVPSFHVDKIEVTKDKLIQLKEDCLTVLNDKSKAKELLPTQDGFFFGSTEYGEMYFDDLQYTVNHIDNVLDMMEDRDFGKMYYFAWW